MANLEKFIQFLYLEFNLLRKISTHNDFALFKKTEINWSVIKFFCGCYNEAIKQKKINCIKRINSRRNLLTNN